MSVYRFIGLDSADTRNLRARRRDTFGQPVDRAFLPLNGGGMGWGRASDGEG